VTVTHLRVGQLKLLLCRLLAATIAAAAAAVVEVSIAVAVDYWRSLEKSKTVDSLAKWPKCFCCSCC